MTKTLSKAQVLRLIKNFKRSEGAKSRCGKRIIRTIEAQYRR